MKILGQVVLSALVSATVSMGVHYYTVAETRGGLERLDKDQLDLQEQFDQMQRRLDTFRNSVDALLTGRSSQGKSGDSETENKTGP